MGTEHLFGEEARTVEVGFLRSGRVWRPCKGLAATRGLLCNLEALTSSALALGPPSTGRGAL